MQSDIISPLATDIMVRNAAFLKFQNTYFFVSEAKL